MSQRVFHLVEITDCVENRVDGSYRIQVINFILDLSRVVSWNENRYENED